MKDALISGKRKKKELLTFFSLLCARKHHTSFCYFEVR